ncbi:hypothetical protein [Legionella waltersii]|uniref:hypothetical protein n=1 Tax=Legionella waltersii TaxID=66969 RepID=UPI0012ED5802|nr:hypothetical protein [Legionella waltersii]
MAWKFDRMNDKSNSALHHALICFLCLFGCHQNYYLQQQDTFFHLALWFIAVQC